MGHEPHKAEPMLLERSLQLGALLLARAQSDHRAARARELGRGAVRRGELDHGNVVGAEARVAVHSAPQPKVLAHGVAEGGGVSREQRLPRAVRQRREARHRVDDRRLARQPARLDIRVDLARVGRVLDKGEPERRESGGGETRIVAVAAPLQQLLCEVHEHAALVRLYDAVLQPGGDAELTALDAQDKGGPQRQRHLLIFDLKKVEQAAQRRRDNGRRAGESHLPRDVGVVGEREVA
mmetsp:Transcript_41853/g.132112  ORF Transcript_41853/g.132112 Transcript_41853/m.132112 type:complete len:238 (+) Transcript_41853:146-859(+)